MLTPHRGRRRPVVAGLALAGLVGAALVVVTAAPSAAAATSVSATVNLSRVVATTDPFAIGVGSSTYGATPLTSSAQAAAERALDARTVRIPVGYRNGRITSAAGGSGGTLDVPALVRQYRSWGYRVLVVLGGRTDDVDIAPGDATRIMQALGFDGITYTAPNEPGNLGQSLAGQAATAAMIVAEGRALRPDFRLTGPVWAYYDRTALTGFAATLGARLGGLDYHHYAMGTTSLSTAQAMAQTPGYGTEVATLRQDLARLGLDVPVIVDELNFSWRYRDGTPGGNNRFFTAVNTVWMTSALGHILTAGGRALPYATQNGPLGIMVEAGQVNPDQRPASSPMPAYWAIANWTGAGRWPHYLDTVYASGTSDPTVEAFAVNNEAGGTNILLVNKSETVTHQLSLAVTGAAASRYAAYRNDPAKPYDAPAVVGSAGFAADPTLTLELPPMTVTVLVMQPGGGGTSAAAPTTAATSVAPSTTRTTPSTTTGAPPASTAASLSSTAGAPGTPTVSVVRSTDGATATITWTAPTTGGAVTGYRVTRDGTDATGGGAYSTTLPASNRSFTFTLLRPDGAYRFSVQAINGAGSGGAAVTTAIAVATPPQGLAVAEAGDPTRVAVTWRAPTATGGLPVTGYRVSRDGQDTTGGGAYSTVRPATAGAFTFSLLKRKTSYTFTVAAITATGTGPAATVRFTTG